MTRRGIGEGTVYRRKDGRWEGAAYLGTVSGKVRRLRVYGRTRKEAHEKLTIRVADMQRGIPIPDQEWTIGAYVEHWMRTIAPSVLRPTTIHLYRNIIRLYLRPVLYERSLTRLTVTELQAIVDREYETGKTPSMLRQMRTVLSAALTRAMREDLVVRNVARLVVLPAYRRRVTQPWTSAEVARFLSAAKSHRLYAAYLIVSLYGVREGEVLGLRWSDIDWKRGQIHIRQQLHYYDGKFTTGAPKSDMGKRDLPLLQPVRVSLQNYKIHHQHIDAETAELGDIIFHTNGQPVSPSYLLWTFKRMQRKAGLRRIRLHDLRHTVATLLKNANVPDRDIQLILGHARITTTQELYEHSDVDRQQQGLSQLERSVLGGDGRPLSRQTLPSDDKSNKIRFVSTSVEDAPIYRNAAIMVYFSAPSERVPVTSVIRQLHARLSIRFLGGLAVNVAVKNRSSNSEQWQLKNPSQQDYR
ncbi:site-specific integrase [Nocardia sp. NBC_01377]|uniref:tyrosine-type recombinase/integrase n=1 Tax=Nocardia sp. NBC_01377 TaxID=2903595 RepID=UPI003251A43B